MVVQHGRRRHAPKPRTEAREAPEQIAAEIVLDVVGEGDAPHLRILQTEDRRKKPRPAGPFRRTIRDAGSVHIDKVQPNIPVLILLAEGPLLRDHENRVARRLLVLRFHAHPKFARGRVRAREDHHLRAAAAHGFARAGDRGGREVREVRIAQA